MFFDEEVENLITETLLQFFNNIELLNFWDPRRINSEFDIFCYETFE